SGSFDFPRSLGFLDGAEDDVELRLLTSRKSVRESQGTARGFVNMARRYGYSRVSTNDQDWTLQLDALVRYGVDDRDIFREKASGAKRDREELRRVLDLLRAGDELVVYRLDRLARSQVHLLQIVEEVEGKGAKLVSIMDAIDTSTATGRMILGVLAVLGEFERNLIRERSQAGIVVAKARGTPFGRPAKVTAAVIRLVGLSHDVGTPVNEACRTLGISRSSYYAALRSAKSAQVEELAQAA
ncbi:recombinase family protein, partial [Azospirillum sp.]|uniref:recombinase family protein n=1 Tax=Azospirillum sp. TaxID=34012 RepID=UPI00260C933E